MKIKDIATELNSDSAYLKLQDGTNKVRMVSELLPVWKAFDQESKTAKVYLTKEGAKTNKDARKRFACYVINRANQQVQIAEFGPKIVEQITNLSCMDSYVFEDLPPYDFIIQKTGSGMETSYLVTGARENTVLSEIEMAAVMSKEELWKVLAKDAEDGDSYIPF